MNARSRFLAVDIGGTKVRLCVLNDSMEILSRYTFQTTGRTGLELVHKIVEEGVRMNRLKEFSAVGACVPGIASKDGTMVWAPNIGKSENVEVRDILEKGLGVPAEVIDDRAAAVLGENWYFNEKDMVVILIGTGIGAGLMMGGQLITGSDNAAGCIGWNIQECDIGRATDVGHLEEILGGRGLSALAANIRLTEKHLEKTTRNRRETRNHSGISAKDIFRSADRGDSLSLLLIERASRLLSVNITNLANTLNPSLVVINGSVGIAIAHRYLGDIRATVMVSAQPYVSRRLRIVSSSLGERAFLIGSAVAAANKLKEIK
jgi:glucokinase